MVTLTKSVFRDDLESHIGRITDEIKENIRVNTAKKIMAETYGPGKWVPNPPVFEAAPWPTGHQAYRELENLWVENIHIEDPEVQDVALVRGYVDCLFNTGMISESDYLHLAEFLDKFYMQCRHYHSAGLKQVSFWGEIIGERQS